MCIIIGREKEIEELECRYRSNRPEFIAVYGRRRVGKTFLVSTYFNDSFAFSATGILGGKFKDEIEAFGDALYDYGFKGEAPKNWREAFHALKSLLLSKLSEGTRCVCILTILTPILMMLTPSKRAGLSKSSLCLLANRQQRSCKDITFSFSSTLLGERFYGKS